MSKNRKKLSDYFEGIKQVEEADSSTQEKLNGIISLVKSITSSEEEWLLVLNSLRSKIRGMLKEHLISLPKHPDGKCKCKNPIAFPEMHTYWGEEYEIGNQCLRCGGKCG